MKTPQEIKEALGHFHGSQDFVRWSPALFPASVLTDGTLYLAENAHCFWLMDAIASHQRDYRLKDQPFQTWKLKPPTKLQKFWVLACEDGNDNLILSQLIEYSDFPLTEGIMLFAVRNEFNGITIMLPGEY